MVGCGHRPYHVVLTVDDQIYQRWQSRIAFYHYKQVKAEQPCTTLGGFTRLLASQDARNDSLADEIPTMPIHRLRAGRCDTCDHGYVVLNRPWSLMHFCHSARFASLTER